MLRLSSVCVLSARVISGTVRLTTLSSNPCKRTGRQGKQKGSSGTVQQNLIKLLTVDRRLLQAQIACGGRSDDVDDGLHRELTALVSLVCANTGLCHVPVHCSPPLLSSSPLLCSSAPLLLSPCLSLSLSSLLLASSHHSLLLNCPVAANTQCAPTPIHSYLFDVLIDRKWE